MPEDKADATQPVPPPPVTAAQENAPVLAAPSPDAAAPASFLRDGDEPAPKAAGRGKVNLRVPFPMEKVTVDGTDITREWTAVDKETAGRAHEAAALSGFKLQQG